MDEHIQTDSIPLNLIIVDDENTTIDLDTLDDIEVKVYNKMSGVVMNTFKFSEGTVIKTDATNGKCRAINDGSTTNVEIGIYRVQIITEETDALYTPKRYRLGRKDAFILNLKK